ncbi:MAG: hypothetical protein EOL88_07515 [Bacteroidia bacterium]|nr:hypothetical protein [Bacteroidales bacterium]MDY0287167.1 hypothetical protein [Bacteroidales bacterium]NCD41924.1 hypothetical protein [Bacteroidia bacterium]
MDKKIVQQVICETLEAVNDQIARITKVEGKIPWIEVDIAKDYLRTLYENILVLERYNGVGEDVAGEEAVDSAPPENQPEMEAKPSDLTEPLAFGFEPVNKESDKIPAEEQIDFSGSDAEIEPDPEPEKTESAEPVLPESKIITHEVPTQPSADKEEVVEKSTLADRLKINQKSLGETIQKQEKTLAENFGRNTLRSLKAAIGINDKFYFVNDLFHGVLKDYNECIGALDAAASVSEAEGVLNKIQDKFQWHQEDEAYIKLKDFVYRKYPS